MNIKFKKLGFLILMIGFIAATQHDSHVYVTKTGNVSFFSHTDVEDIEADNHKTHAAFDAKSGKVQFSLLVKDFKFEKALMEEHFNENYMESHKFPKATFNGSIDSIQNINVHKDGTYSSPVTGQLKMKDQTRTITTKGTFTVKGDMVNGKAKFVVRPDDYNITIPKVVKKNISENIEISVDVDFKHKH